ncbi:MAG TPA: LD-carboxypeptidase, partial [Lactobacillus sp.]|nr:LD-carboxypeptidase [Lactobacillus sp.]
MLIPARLKQNDEIRIIAPSRTLDCVGGFAANQTAQEKLTQLGFKVTFGN